ncbi:hypothetical protein [Streptomyces sp. NPDC091212]|uniref:hypothetical protein n=1 Tax=Streptomyces sp. NPDC091212 TaxID=3155191 RepID=UPI003436E3E5
MSWVKNGMRYSLKVVEQPDWTSLSNSSTPGVFRALLHGSGSKVVGHAGLRSPALWLSQASPWRRRRWAAG